MTRDDHLDETLDRVLRGTDPVRDLTLDEARSARAAQRLDEILAGGPAAGGVAGADSGRRGGVRAGRAARWSGGLLGAVGRHRWAALAGTAALAFGALGLGSATFLADQPAHAEWNAAPQPVSPGDEKIAAEHCTSSMGAEDPSFDVADGGPLKPLISERRGDAVLTVSASSSVQKTCISFLDGDDVSATVWSLNAVTALDERGPELGPDEISAPDLTSISITADGVTVDAPNGEVASAATLVQGTVGADVVGVTATAPGGVETTATIANGHYVLWWPEAAEPAGSTAGEDLRFTVELKDGTVLRDVQPVERPEAPGEGETAPAPSDGGGTPSSDGGEG